MLGRLLREAQPELMEALIQASRDGDNSRLHALSGGESISVEDDEEEEDITHGEEEEDVSYSFVHTLYKFAHFLYSKIG